MNNFFRRTLTGAWIVIFIMGGFWLHPVSFFLTGLIMLIVTQYEYYKIIRKSGVNPQVIPGILTGIMVYVLCTLVASKMIPANSMLLIIPMILVIMIRELYRKQEKPFDSLAHTFFSIFYTTLPFAMFPFSSFARTGLNSLLPHESITFSPGIIIGFFLLIWANDTGAYLTGMTIGRHRLFERISPKKSWEGFFGGLLLAIVAGWFLSEWLGVVDRIHWVIISIIVSIAGTYGDLLESMLKEVLESKTQVLFFRGMGDFSIVSTAPYYPSPLFIFLLHFLDDWQDLISFVQNI